MLKAIVIASLLFSACVPRGHNENSAALEAQGPSRAEFVKGLSGRVVMKGDAGWDKAVLIYAARFQYQSEPKAVLFVKTKEDVVNALAWVRKNNVPFRIRSGRHSYEAYSSIKNGLVIDMSDMNSIQYNNGTKLATIGGGVKVLPLYEELWKHGVTVPAASAGTVGMAGLIQGGGFGFTSRRFGTASDQVVDFEVVLGDGRIVHANVRENADLFWALRGGGGGNFGVITQMTLKTYPVSKVGVYVAVWDWSNFDALVKKYQQWGPDADPGLTTFLRLASDNKITLFSVYTPKNESELAKGRDVIKPMLDVAKPIYLEQNDVVYIDAARKFAAVTQAGGNPDLMAIVPQTFKASSAFSYKNFPDAAIKILRESIEKSPKTGGIQPSMVQLLAAGGAAATQDIDKMGFPARKSRFIVQYDAYWDTPSQEKQNLDWITSMRNALLPYARGAYVNYHDNSLKSPMVEYYGHYLKRFVAAKAKYDPQNVFNFPHSIPLKLTPEQERELSQLAR